MADTTPCAHHPKMTAEERCDRCDTPICSLCSTYDGLLVVCPECERRARRRRFALWGAVIVAISVALGGGVFYAYSSYQEHLERERIAEMFGKDGYFELVADLESRLDEEPCERRIMKELAETYMRVHKYEKAVARSHEFLAECPAYPRLRWLTYEANKKMERYDAAADEATALVEQYPNDKDFRWWRGFVYEKKGDWQSAARDYRQAIALVPQLTSIPFNLANVYREMGEPCRGLFPLEQTLFHHQDAVNAGEIRRRIDGLYAEGGCASWRGRGTMAHASPSEGEQPPDVHARLGEAVGRFSLRTDVSHTLVTRAFAERTGLELEDDRELLVAMDGEAHEGTLHRVSTITASSTRAIEVPIVVVDELPGELDGVLGMSYLSRFDLDVHPGRQDLIVSGLSDVTIEPVSAPAGADGPEDGAPDSTSGDAEPGASEAE